MWIRRRAKLISVWKKFYLWNCSADSDNIFHILFFSIFFYFFFGGGCLNVEGLLLWGNLVVFNQWLWTIISSQNKEKTLTLHSLIQKFLCVWKNFFWYFFSTQTPRTFSGPDPGPFSGPFEFPDLSHTFVIFSRLETCEKSQMCWMHTRR